MSTCSFKETNNILWCYFSVFYFVIDVEHLRREAVAASSRLTYKLMDTLNTGVEQAYVNQRKLETEAKQLQAHAARFSKQTVQWLQMLEAFNKALKELGDVENWSRVIEADMTAIASALEYAYKG